MIFLSSGTGKILRECNPGLLTAKIFSAICRRVETREERKERRKREKAEQVAYKLEQVRSLYRDRGSLREKADPNPRPRYQ